MDCIKVKVNTIVLDHMFKIRETGLSGLFKEESAVTSETLDVFPHVLNLSLPGEKRDSNYVMKTEKKLFS